MRNPLRFFGENTVGSIRSRALCGAEVGSLASNADKTSEGRGFCQGDSIKTAPRDAH